MDTIHDAGRRGRAVLADVANDFIEIGKGLLSKDDAHPIGVPKRAKNAATASGSA
ncbi:MAG: hypothetical protein AB7O44_18405 [Hyphomicrobiaceae bacterium]